MQTKRVLALALVAVLIISTVLPVTAQATETGSAWVELLEFSTVDDSGSNLFKLTTTGTIRLATPQYMRCTKIDLLIAHPAGYAPSSIKVRYNGVYYPLTMQKVDSTTVRAYGDNIPDTLYADFYIQFNKSGSASISYQLLSCRVSAINAQQFVADADVYVQGSYHDQSEHITVPGVSSDGGVVDDQIRISVYDWAKYDSLTIWGSSTDFPINSIRATINTVGLPFTVSYMEQGSFGWVSETDTLTATGAGEWEWSVEDADPSPYGKWLYCITVDLADVDRTANGSDPLYVYLTGYYETVNGYSFNCQYVNGAIVVADTTNASWWTKFTAFFTDLLGGDRADEGDEFASEMESQAQQMQDAVSEMDSVTRPPVDDVQVSVDDYVSADDMASVGDMVGSLMSDPLVLSMVMISLILALAAYIIFGKR